MRFFFKIIFFSIFLIGLNSFSGQANKQRYRLLKPPEGFQISTTKKEIIETRALLPEGNNSGLAKKYPGDKGIENDPDIIFVEKFDAGPGYDLLSPIAKKMIFKPWDTVKRGENMQLSSDVPHNSADDRSLLFERGSDHGGGGYLYRNIEPGVNQVFVRYYVKFNQNCGPVGHLGATIGGYNPPTPWPQGGAGAKPDGSKHFHTRVDTYGKDWNWDFYTYWQGMHAHGDGAYWGTPFLAKGPKPKVVKGQWVCVETMVKLNDPVSDSNGEQAFWIDGKLFRRGGQVASHIGPGFPKGRWRGGWWSADSDEESGFEGFQWRNFDELTINYIQLKVYKLKAPQNGKSRIWFDNLVVARRYIGPMQ